MTTYTHNQNGGKFELLDQGQLVDGLDAQLVSYQAEDAEAPAMMTLEKWQAEYRPLAALECHHCGGTGKDPKRKSAREGQGLDCGYCHGSTLLDAKGDAITRDNETSDQLRDYITGLKNQIHHLQHELDYVKSVPGVSQTIESFKAQGITNAMAEAYRKEENQIGPGGACYRGD
ncbi:hypothetical protein SAMN05660443_0203 [Marinospirillum celere]|uniref:Uncharacterized protein n=1 Tax=Marinospirillum celere TaxID=1122252 RepID=A0A1I1DYI8_9GAMM|nr:hypothetical protein [Marinospirillum celere]SFB79971.1 hypothetical protein SAMN05660443_0203 [Marinospirillum celere]